MSTMRGPKVPIGKLLIDQGKITPDQLKQALTAQQQSPGVKIGRILVEQGYVSERDVLNAYAQQINIPAFDPAKMPPEMVTFCQALPLANWPSSMNADEEMASWEGIS